MVNGQKSKVDNKKIGKTLFVSTVARRTRPYLPSGGRMYTSFDIAIFNNPNGFSSPLVRVLISEDLPQYVMPEIHGIITQLAQELDSEDFDSIEEAFLGHGFIFQSSSSRDIWHGFKKLNLIYVIDMEQKLADALTQATVNRATEQMKGENKTKR